MYEYKLKTIDVNDSKAVVVKIYKNNNDFVNKGDIVCTMETTKVTFDIESEVNGYILFLVNEGQKVFYGQTLFVVKDYENEEVLFEKINPQKSKLNITQKAQTYIDKNNMDLKELISQIGYKNIITLEDVINVEKKNNTTSVVDDNGNSRITMNHRKRIVILGASDAAEVVADILLDNREYEIIGFVDDNPQADYKFYGISVIYSNVRKFAYEYDRSLFDAVIISFGGSNLENKKSVYNLYVEQNIPFINAIDRTAKIGRNVSIGKGNVIGAFAYIGTSTVIHDNNWIASSVNIDHHNCLGSHNLIGPNMSSPGEVTIGDLNKIGANASLSNYVTVGNNNQIMNNKCIVRNVGDNEIIK